MLSSLGVQALPKKEQKKKKGKCAEYGEIILWEGLWLHLMEFYP